MHALRHNYITQRSRFVGDTREVSESREELPEAVFMHDDFEFARLTNQ